MDKSKVRVLTASHARERFRYFGESWDAFF